LNLTDWQQLVVGHIGHGHGLDLAGREVAEAGDDELADRAAFRLEDVRSSAVGLDATHFQSCCINPWITGAISR
jgi:hypothetical protein